MNNKEELMRFKITSNMMAVCINPQPSHVEMTRQEYEKICEQYGHIWQFVSQCWINYFKDSEWRGAKVR